MEQVPAVISPAADFTTLPKVISDRVAAFSRTTSAG